MEKGRVKYGDRNVSNLDGAFKPCCPARISTFEDYVSRKQNIIIKQHRTARPAVQT